MDGEFKALMEHCSLQAPADQNSEPLKNGVEGGRNSGQALGVRLWGEIVGGHTTSTEREGGGSQITR